MDLTLQSNTLAIHGGKPIRSKRMPPRLAFGKEELAQVLAAIEYYQSKEQDPPYQGHFEQMFCNAFAEFMGGGFADAVASGTGACFVALAALQLPKGSEVVISPVTDSGPLNCIIMQGLTPVVADSMPKNYNMGVEQFLSRITSKTSALFAVHCAGQPLEIDRLVEESHKRGIRVLEDCSQAPGAMWKEKRVGTFGDVAAFSTMYRKTLSAGGSSGIVYAKDEATFRRAQAHADRGKPVWRKDLGLNDPRHAMFPALNFNTDELSCAMGLSSLKRLEAAMGQRLQFVSRLKKLLDSKSKVCRAYDFDPGASPFFCPIFVDSQKIKCSKVDFAFALRAEGIDLLPEYGCLVGSWDWAQSYLSDHFVTANAFRMRDETFNLFLNERYGEEEAQDIVAAVLKVEEFFGK